MDAGRYEVRRTCQFVNDTDVYGKELSTTGGAAAALLLRMGDGAVDTGAGWVIGYVSPSSNSFGGRMAVRNIAESSSPAYKRRS